MPCTIRSRFFATSCSDSRLPRLISGAGERDGKPTQLLDADIEADTGSERRFLENEGERLALERAAISGGVRLDLAASRDQIAKLVGRQVPYGEEVRAAHVASFPGRTGATAPGRGTTPSIVRVQMGNREAAGRECGGPPTY